MSVSVAEGKSGKVVIKNVGLMLSGDLDAPILDADTIVVVIEGITHIKAVNLRTGKGIVSL